ncbi:MAG: Adaptive-response sensory-kinase SasA [Candidatus Methanoperedenaceae archaeon GB37]|nr:Adaptive-response sensory-kinase SasA [Candidatus Methanoperedenaceae archaeon GB37]CAD7782352.1 MAG: Adaptive-response sensory-kinase SasA [Candidatus Methanoperedenaceae archaeon GB37]
MVSKIKRFIKIEKTKSVIILCSILICVGLSYYLNFAIHVKIAYTDILSSPNLDKLLNFLSLKAIYTDFFYIPIILTAIWYRKKVIYLALFLSLFHIYVSYFSLGFLPIGTIEKCAVFIILAYVIALISEKRMAEQKKLQKSEERLKIAYHKLKETQNQLIQHEKMAAMGRLASGFAHEIRNPLEIILMGIEFLDATLPEKNNLIEKTIEKIKQAVNRANKIIIDTLQFSRMSEFKFESIDICKSLDETIDLIKHKAVLNNIKINRNYPQKHMRVKADKNMLQQVFLNLFMNAMDAMPKGGEIKVRVYDKIANQLGYKIGKRESDYFKIGDKIIVVEIEDTGIGIPKNILSKIFDPFFTTKKVGEGTGLGLSVVHLIIDQHRGIIDVESEVNKGTKFIIMLPLAKNSNKEVQYDRDEKNTFN